VEVIELAALTLLVVSVLWGATARPGRPFTWTMFSGSSKAFVHICEEHGARPATIDDLKLSPDSHYLLEVDLRRIAETGLPALQGVIVGSRGSFSVRCEGPGFPLVSEPVAAGEDLELLAAALRRYACPRR
jgi:hypothetical protein